MKQSGSRKRISASVLSLCRNKGAEETGTKADGTGLTADSLLQHFVYPRVFFSFAQVFACLQRKLLVAALEQNELFVRQLFQVQKRVVGIVIGANEFIELKLYGYAVTVLGVLNEEHHEERRDGRARVNDELPAVAIAKVLPARGPEEHDQCRRDKRDRMAGHAGNMLGKRREGLARTGGINFLNGRAWHGPQCTRRRMRPEEPLCQVPLT